MGPDRVVVFSAAGVFLRAFGEQGKGKLCLPMRVAVDEASSTVFNEPPNLLTSI
jgi:hypothetical protein